MTVAILGAGMAGAAAASALRAAGVEVALFDKSRGPGGRMATRRLERVQFDHGAQYARARDLDFAALLARAEAAGAAAPWPAAAGTPPAMVGTPGMNALVRFVLADAPLTTGFEAGALRRSGEGWHLLAKDGASAGPFAAVILTVPSVQAVPLLAPHHTGFAEAARAAEMAPCWSGLFAWDAPVPLALPHDALAAHGVSWLAHDGGKPGRGGAPTLVLHASPDWSRENLERSADDVRDHLARLLTGPLGLPAPATALSHRWRYAQVTRAADVPQPFDPATGLGIAGDWLVGPRVEAAWLSGRRAAEALLAAAPRARGVAAATGAV